MADCPEFFDEIQYHLHDEFYEAGSEIITAGETCSSIYIVVSGEIEILVNDN